MRTIPSLALSWAAMPFFWTSKYTLSAPTASISSRAWAAAASGRSSSRCWQKRDCRHPVSAIRPCPCAASCCMSSGGLAPLVPLQKAGRGQLDQVAVAGRIGRQQGQMEAVHPARAAARVVVDQVDLTADDRLDVVLETGGVELHGAVHHAVIGQRQGGLPERRRPLRESFDLAGPVEQRVLGVDVEMGAGRGHQSRRSSSLADDGTAAPRICVGADAARVRTQVRPRFQPLCARLIHLRSSASGQSSPVIVT